MKPSAAHRASSGARWPPLFSPVMATGIVSLAAREAGAETLSTGLLCLAGALYLILLGYHLVRLAATPSAVLEELRSAAIFDYLTFVAAGALLGGGLLAAGASEVSAWLLLVVAAVSWIAITLMIATELLLLHSLHPRSETQGGWLLAVVAPQALAVLALELAPGALADVALSLWVLGTLLYPPIALERLGRIEFGQLAGTGLRADDWILMGALAISTLAGSDLLDQSALGGSLGGVHAVLFVVVLVQFGLAWVFVPLLVWGEIRHRTTPPAARGPTGSRWATVFPLGMLAVASRAFAAPAGLPVLRPVSDVCFTVALVAWCGAVALTVMQRAHDPSALGDGRREAGGDHH